MSQSALPSHWNQKSELGGNDRTSKYSWGQCVRAAVKKKLRLVRTNGYYKLIYPSGTKIEMAELDGIMECIQKYTPPPGAQR